MNGDLGGKPALIFGSALPAKHGQNPGGRFMDGYSLSLIQDYAAGMRPTANAPQSNLGRRYSVVSPSTSRRSSISGTTNSVKPQFKQTSSLGKTHTMGLSRPLSPGKCMATCPVDSPWFSKWQDAQDIRPDLPDCYPFLPIVVCLSGGYGMGFHFRQAPGEV